MTENFRDFYCRRWCDSKLERPRIGLRGECIRQRNGSFETWEVVGTEFKANLESIFPSCHSFEALNYWSVASHNTLWLSHGSHFYDISASNCHKRTTAQISVLSLPQNRWQRSSAMNLRSNFLLCLPSLCRPSFLAKRVSRATVVCCLELRWL